MEEASENIEQLTGGPEDNKAYSIVEHPVPLYSGTAVEPIEYQQVAKEPMEGEYDTRVAKEPTEHDNESVIFHSTKKEVHMEEARDCTGHFSEEPSLKENDPIVDCLRQICDEVCVEEEQWGFGELEEEFAENSKESGVDYRMQVCNEVDMEEAGMDMRQLASQTAESLIKAIRKQLKRICNEAILEDKHSDTRQLDKKVLKERKRFISESFLRLCSEVGEEKERGNIGQLEQNAAKRRKESVDNHSMQIRDAPGSAIKPPIVKALDALPTTNGKSEGSLHVVSVSDISPSKVSNVMASLLADFEGDEKLVEESYKSTLTALIKKHFDPKLADKIFDPGRNEDIGWLAELVSDKYWRDLIYALVQRFPESKTLRYCVNLACFEGFESEIIDLKVVVLDLEIFSNLLVRAVDRFFAKRECGPKTKAYQEALSHLVKVACRNDTTYIYAQTLLHILIVEMNDEAVIACAEISRAISRRVRHHVKGTLAMELALLQSNIKKMAPPHIQAIRDMTEKGALNLADISALYQAYTSSNPPSQKILRQPCFLNLLIDALFSDNGCKVDINHRREHIYLLAYATCAHQKKNDQDQNEEIGKTIDAVYRTIDILDRQGALIREAKTVMEDIHLPVIAMGVLQCLRERLLTCFVVEPIRAVHGTLLQKIATIHPGLRIQIFELLSDYYDLRPSREEWTMATIRWQHGLIDHFLHLLSIGIVLPVVEKVARILQEGRIDRMVVRYFVTKVLAIIEPPYSQDFIDAFLPVVTDERIFIAKAPKTPKVVDKFIEHCERAKS